MLKYSISIGNNTFKNCGQRLHSCRRQQEQVGGGVAATDLSKAFSSLARKTVRLLLMLGSVQINILMDIDGMKSKIREKSISNWRGSGGVWEDEFLRVLFIYFVSC
jgi:hypothetical protein